MNGSRREFLAATGAALLGGLAGCASAPTDDGAGGTTDGDATSDDTDSSTATADTGGDGSLAGLEVAYETVATGFASPVDVAIPEAFGGSRRFVVDQPGRIWLHDDSGLRSESYLDITDRVVDLNGYDERGFLGVAFHPEFADNGRLYLRYSTPRRSGTPSNYSHTFVLSELTVDPEATTVSADSERTLLELPQPQSNHNAGAVAFGPDGYLYVATGDGGGANDEGRGHVDDWYDAVSGGNGQDVTGNLLGSVLRIDVDSTGGVSGDDDRPYGIPEDNPLVGSDGRDEQYAWGFRNPWRLSFDGEDCYVADVGQGAWEEVNLLEAGGNYGWNVREGAHCFRAGDCPTETPDGAPLIDPVLEYPHSGDGPSGVAVIGGHVYRGEAIPDLSGAYVFADWQSEGRLFAARPSESRPWDIAELPVADRDDGGTNVLAFGRDPDGELYVCTSDRGVVTGSSGALNRLTGV
ncbi:MULTISPECIES: sorbosone dehydrogenase family protein [unclassified Haloferax]|uniref:PQQ-dependent sugar dehydrogenase n=1 Tax=Haloferax TaxID=2251 RepID=UPI0002AFA8D0|nr:MULTISPECIES: PQQ-dependent sugar dehydrogenase [unclassified Haloferax]ELZ59741.1 putative PQQ-dependent glucose dehydrogenase [Haloferax sp. ATCC BAA-646]ELZ64665.1 putative PQQ-dependent glucose dehydrogenase [Haloferax sp. ATCC BAA-645]ELZ69501.1 putative PQQ-dependent glucose dehydrogenase [Haloferax sp. ATCC BAA-644]